MMAKVFSGGPPWTLAALRGCGWCCGGRPPPGHRLWALRAVFVVRLELNLQKVPVLLTDDLANESRQSLQVTKESLQLSLQQPNPLVHVLSSFIQVRNHVIHDVLSLQQGRGTTSLTVTVTLLQQVSYRHAENHCSDTRVVFSTDIASQ